MPRAAVIVPFPFDEEGLDYRRAEMEQVELSGQVTFDYKPLKAGPKHFIGRHDEMLVEFAIFEAGIALAEEGYDAITVNTLSDSGVPELRAVLDIPVVSNGKSSLLYALTLGTRFCVIAQTDPTYPQYTDAWLAFYKNLMKKFEVAQFCSSIELFEAQSDMKSTVRRPRGRGLPQDEGSLREGPRQGGRRDRSRLHDSLSGRALTSRRTCLSRWSIRDRSR